MSESQADVGAQLRVHRRCLQRFQGVDDRWQRLIVHPDQGQGITDQVALLGDDHGHGLPGVTHLAARQDRVDGRAQLLRFGLPPGRQGLDHPLQVIGGDDGDHPRRVAGRCRIDGPDGGVGVGAAQHRRVQHILELEIVEKRTLAGEQSRIFKPFQRLACVNHWGLLSVWGTMVSKRSQLALDALTMAAP